MKPLNHHDVVGLRITDVIISIPDKSVSMSDSSYSAGYVKLENGLVIDLDGSVPLHDVGVEALQNLSRDHETESEFRAVIGSKVVDIRSDGSLVYILVEGDRFISVVPAQFWVRPYLESNESVPQDACSVWES